MSQRRQQHTRGRRVRLTARVYGYEYGYVYGKKAEGKPNKPVEPTPKDGAAHRPR